MYSAFVQTYVEIIKDYPNVKFLILGSDLDKSVRAIKKNLFLLDVDMC